MSNNNESKFGFKNLQNVSDPEHRSRDEMSQRMESSPGRRVGVRIYRFTNCSSLYDISIFSPSIHVFIA